MIYFWAKYVTRVVKMISCAFIFGNCSYDLFFSKRLSYTNPLRANLNNLNISMWISVIISGLASMILLVIEKRYEKDFNFQIWKKALVFKFILSILVSPLLEVLIGLVVKENEKVDDYAIPIRFSV